MASSKQQSLSLYGAFYLPIGVLTGVSLSFILPPALNFLIPVLNSALFISLPHLWHAFLSWVTPPCLFVLLNGIIVVLTASAGALSSSESDSEADFYAHLLGKVENSHRASSGSLMADPPASDSSTDMLLKMKTVHMQSPAASMVDSYSPASSQAMLEVYSAAEMVETHNPVSSQTMLCVRTPHDVHGVLETEELNIADDEKPSNLSRLILGSRSFSHMRSDIRIWEEEEEEEGVVEEEEENDERISMLPKLAVVNKSFSFGCRSEPSSPQFATPSKGNPIKRSLSVDSASFNDNQTSTGSSEDLSDEAFRKRVEDFISKMNAQLRSEAK